MAAQALPRRRDMVQGREGGAASRDPNPAPPGASWLGGRPCSLFSSGLLALTL